MKDFVIAQKGEPMTDTEMERRKAICEVAGVAEIDDLSDGFHTFRQLYYQRMMLFVTIVKQNKDKAWKSLRHEDGELCFGGGWFIVGVDTPEGSYTYHYEDGFYSLFDCEELEYAKHWDGHTEKDVTRLLSLPSAQPERKIELYGDESAIEILSELRSWFSCFDEKEGLAYHALSLAIREIKANSAAEPERKKGKWNFIGDNMFECTSCGVPYTTQQLNGLRNYDTDPYAPKFCPSCGADMRGEQDEDD